MKEKEQNEEKMCSKLEDPDQIESYLASDTWRPGKAQPPLSTFREAWLKCLRNSWVKNLIFLAGGSGFTLILTSSAPFGAYSFSSFVLGIGGGVLSAAIILGCSFIAFLFRELYARKR